jgi:ATF/CREB family transcription factor
MLAGPQNFDPTSFRTGLTPDLSSFKTGLTPLGTAGGSYPPPSPNTAAFLAMVTNASGSAITPNTLSALSGNPIDTHAANNGSLPSTQTDQDTQEGAGSGVKMTQPNYVNGAHHGSDESRAQPGAEPNRTGKQGNHGNGTNQAASGLFMLSQAHQELAKRGDGNDPYAGSAFTHGGTGLSDAKSLYSNVPSSATAGQSKSMANGSKQQRLQDAQVPQPKNGKRKNGMVVEGSKKASKKTKGTAKTEEFSPSGESDELVDESNYDMSGVNGGMHDYSNEVGADEDEKRRNFLERNRQAALKCRQRKKAWLASLQAKVEYLQTDNEHLQGSVGALRNEVMFLKSQLMQAQRQLAAHGLAPQADQMQRHSVSGPMGIPTSAMMPQAMTQVPHSNIHAMAAAAAAAAANNGGMGGGVPGAPGHFQQPQHMPRPTHIPLHGGNNVNGPFGGPIGANKQQAARQGSMQAV